MELQKAKKDIFSAIIFIIISMVLFFIAIPLGVPLRASWGGSIGVDSRTFPYFTAVVMGITSSIFLVTSCFEYKRAKQKDNHRDGVEKVFIEEELRVALVFVLFVLYAFLFAKIGFILSTLVVSPITLFLLGERKIIRYVSVYAVGALLFIIFKILLKVQLP